jgi:hypothetical protein
VHNHPSGFACPSDQDRKVTRRLYSDGRRLGIYVKDSVIIAAGGYYSFREDGLMGGWRGASEQDGKIIGFGRQENRFFRRIIINQIRNKLLTG